MPELDSVQASPCPSRAILAESFSEFLHCLFPRRSQSLLVQASLEPFQKHSPTGYSAQVFTDDCFHQLAHPDFEKRSLDRVHRHARVPIEQALRFFTCSTPFAQDGLKAPR